MPLHQAAVTPAPCRPLRRPLLAARNAASAVAALALLALGHASTVQAQDWPQSGKTLRILSPFPPGGTADQLARLIGARLSQQTGVVAVVDNLLKTLRTVQTFLSTLDHTSRTCWSRPRNRFTQTTWLGLDHIDHIAQTQTITQLVFLHFNNKPNNLLPDYKLQDNLEMLLL